MAEQDKVLEDEQVQSNQGTTNKKEIPMEAYAMFIHLYREWLDTAEEDQLAIMGEGIERMGIKKSAQYKEWEELEREDDIDRGLAALYFSDDGKKDKQGDAEDNVILSNNPVFDEYMSDVYLSFFKRFEGFRQFENYEDFEANVINAFVDFMRKTWKREDREFKKEKDKFLKRVFNDWDKISDKLTDEEFDKFMAEELQKREAQYIKIRNQNDKERTWLHSMGDLFFKLAQLEKSCRKGERRKAAALESIDDENFDEQKLKDPVTPEGQVITHDRLAGYMDRLDDTDKKIAHLRGEGYNLESIAKEVGLSPSTVSRRLKKMYNFGKE